MIKKGRITEERKNYYLVDTGEELIPSVLKGVLKRKHKRILAGDFVDIEVINTDISEGVIRKLHKRKNELYKPAIANVDRVIFIITLKEPAIELEYVDRFLIYMEKLDIPIILAFNKIDLIDREKDTDLLQIIDDYKNIGYECIDVSAKENFKITELKDYCAEGVSIFAGPSGAGKSTILSIIFPEIHFDTNELSKNISRGVHTTTFTSLLKSDNSFIADSPGFSFMDLPLMDEEDTKLYFPEFQEHSELCKFNNCLHLKEPNCAVKKAVDAGQIKESRYNNYSKFFDEVKSKRINHRDRGNRRVIKYSN